MVNLNSDKGAIISPDGQYRYLLWRNWNLSLPRLLWVMLNPSTADATADDPTLRRCIAFSKGWGHGAPFSQIEGFGGLEVVNLFAYISPDSKRLNEIGDPVGIENDRYKSDAATRATDIVVAWGELGACLDRDCETLELLSRHSTRPLLCLGLLPNGCPRHPLYVPENSQPLPYLGYKKRCHHRTHNS